MNTAEAVVSWRSFWSDLDRRMLAFARSDGWVIERKAGMLIARKRRHRFAAADVPQLGETLRQIAREHSRASADRCPGCGRKICEHCETSHRDDCPGWRRFG